MCAMEPAVREALDTGVKKKRRYTGPPKGSQQAKDRMAIVRAAQWAKNGLTMSNADTGNEPALDTSRAPVHERKP